MLFRSLTTVVHAGDQIQFVPARHGEAASRTLRELLGPDFYGQVLVNNVKVDMDTPLEQGDVVLTLRQTPPAPRQEPAAQPPAAPVQPVVASATTPVASTPEAVPARPVVRPGILHIVLNGEALTLPPKDNGSPYYLMDLLEHSGIDFEHLDRAVRLEVNGVERGFQYELKEQDSVSISLI